MEPADSRRGVPRYTANCLLCFASTEVTGYAYMRNLSAGGCFVETEKPVENGAEFAVEIFLDLGTRAESMCANVSCQWSNDVPASGRLGMGLKFVSMDNASRERLDEGLNIVSQSLAPLPDRAT